MVCKKHQENPARGYSPCEGCEVERLQKENKWMKKLLEIIRDKAELKYNGNTGLLAFSDLKDEASRL